MRFSDSFAYNFNPATIFLGDSGSLFIGFLLSALALNGAQKAPTIVAVAIPIVSFGLPILETVLSIVRRLISGRPVFTADREHIHHKLLQHGMTHRQVVILLYGVSACFAMLSLFLLWPTGSSLGLVLAVLGIGIWIGVQHLGYLEFGELARVAHRTLNQPQIFVNNLAIRRATEELKVARDYDQVRQILVAAFGSNDFDSFELKLELLPGEMVPFESRATGATRVRFLPLEQARRGESPRLRCTGKSPSICRVPPTVIAELSASIASTLRGICNSTSIYSPPLSPSRSPMRSIARLLTPRRSSPCPIRTVL